MDMKSLPTELTIYTVSEMYPQWIGWLGQGADTDDALTVDASTVAEVDGAGLQLLVSLSMALAARHRGLRLVDPSPALVAAATAIGVPALLDASVLPGASS